MFTVVPSFTSLAQAEKDDTGPAEAADGETYGLLGMSLLLCELSALLILDCTTLGRDYQILKRNLRWVTAGVKKFIRRKRAKLAPAKAVQVVTKTVVVRRLVKRPKVMTRFDGVIDAKSPPSGPSPVGT